ncbi:PREDICTED: transcription initiation factor IIA large subunit isoform X1 [Theobroma cacao]|uniref:Transcription initiation factor IIA large subunit isoform X1 n=1 Tax=Theobroma cacao TaxID=3641 RepID=A0AB32WUP5_THECC|nr:PREDICTED: transcription initiation factor IIA large subunit isoform X1 [Theobroma cacao]
MASSTTSAVYIHVIEDVINKVRDEFINNGGPGETVLNELQGIWEMKMMQAGVVCGPIERSSGQKQPTPGGPITPVHDLNVPYEGPEEYETPTADMLFPPTPLQTPVPTPLPGSADGSMYNIPTGSSDYPTPVNDGGGNTDAKGARPSPYMQSPSPWPNQRTPLSVDVNVGEYVIKRAISSNPLRFVNNKCYFLVAYVEGRDEVDRGPSHQPLTQDFFMMSSGKRKREDFTTQYHNGGGYIPQQDGAGDAIYEVAKAEGSKGSDFLDRRDSTTTAKSEILAHLARSSSKIPQLDGPIPDPYDDMLSTPNIYNYQGVVNEDYNVVNTPAPNDLQAATPAPVAQNDTGDDDDDEPLNEDDDDDELDDVDQGEELNTQHLVLAQFDKVTRTKSRWKCTLKDGIMHINNKDILFNKATGEFDF